ncbi:hypothetical protein RchiOBHm_Chr6g0276561 [Rosa chinensis]|uniref:Uncharacterized protein n=1 Tax=Rosa chinensis TaxID=74649 RepID=A0A2P6PSA7_ROSCH|nr:hypothetical protein RchiOBHm_Chr6g0276561 [Rosa chinensis]
MGKRRDRVLVVTWLLLLLMLILLVGNTQSSRPLLPDERTNKVYKVMKKPNNRNSDQNSSSVQRSFFAFLPKATPIPPSGPSREHNGIDLESSSQLSP